MPGGYCEINTRSHTELGSQAFQRRWYFVLRHGRVGRRQAITKLAQMKNYIVVTGGAGFVGSNLIKILIQKTKKLIISLDDYSSGSARNHIKNDRVIYIRGNTTDIKNKLQKFEKKIHSLFHFGEFSSLQKF